jgi:hypothetical protein
VSIDIIIKKGFHLQANPVNDEFLIPTAVQLKPDKNIIPGAPVYPPGHLFILKGASDTLSVYGGRFSIGLPFQILPAAQPKEYTLKENFTTRHVIR